MDKVENKQSRISPEDLGGVEAFRVWIKNNLKHLYKPQEQDKKIPNEHLLIYLDYVKRVVIDSEQIEHPFWLRLIRTMESELQAIKRVEE